MQHSDSSRNHRGTTAEPIGARGPLVVHVHVPPHGRCDSQMAEAARRPAIDGSLWTELTTEERAAATVLQYEEASWDAGETPFVCSVPWKQLSTCEQSAAVVLGYDEESWKRELDASLEL